MNRKWPGNVRELSHLMERATLLRPEAVLDPHTGECWWEAELHRLKGEGGSRTAPTGTAKVAEVDVGGPGLSPVLLEAETCFLQALGMADASQQSL